MAHGLRRVVVCAVVAAVLIPLSGCWVFSVYPLAGPTDDLVFDRFLTGSWWNAQNKCTVSFTRVPDERAYRVVYITAKDSSEGCWLGQGETASFEGKVVELGGARFLDVVPADVPLRYHMVLAHSFYRIKFDVNSLTITPMNYQAMEALMQGEKLRGVARSDNIMVVTADTKELRELVRQNAVNPDMWNEGGKLEFQRRFDGQ